MPLSDEQLEIQALARQFAAAELAPRSAKWDEARALDEGVFGELAELGFLGMLVPEEFGGLDFDVLTYLVVLEELARGDAAVALAVAIHNGPVAGMVARHGSEEQKSAWLPRLASGEALGAFALSESGAGSDPSALETRAEEGGDGWALTGEKRWVTNGARAGLAIVMARMEAGAIGAFLVDPAQDGYSAHGGEKTMGLRASQTVSVSLADAHGDPLGRPDRGLAYALSALDTGRVGIAAQAVGIAQAAMEHATRYAMEREQFGRHLADFGAIQAKLAEMLRQILGARALTYGAGEVLQASRSGATSREGPDGLTARAAVAKLAASEAATWVADEAVQIFGGYGYMRDYPVEKLLRDAKGTEIYEGTSEILRLVIAREVLRDAQAG